MTPPQWADALPKSYYSIKTDLINLEAGDVFSSSHFRDKWYFEIFVKLLSLYLDLGNTKLNNWITRLLYCQALSSNPQVPKAQPQPSTTQYNSVQTLIGNQDFGVL